ncbi:hypothetical protein AHAS_Ahas03G0131200 [Arachis hypogaea]
MPMKLEFPVLQLSKFATLQFTMCDQSFCFPDFRVTRLMLGLKLLFYFNGTPRMTSLDLSNNSLIGEIPVFLVENLPSLRVL